MATPYTVTIPFIGVKGLFTDPASDGGKLRAVADGTATSMVPTALTNPAYKAFAGFSSGGPRTGDSNLKPDITAPGVSIVSTGNGTGNKAATISGTSMASPHTAGVAALTVQAHPGWSVEDLKAAIQNTGDPAGVAVNRISRGGTGLVQPAKSTKTQVVAKASGDPFAISISYGFAELLTNFSASREITLTNHGASAATFNVAPANQTTSSPQSVTLSSPTVTVPAGGTATISMTLNVVASTVGSSSSGLAFREVAGLITFTPATASDNNGVTLRVPYYLVPRSSSNVDVSLGSTSVQNEVNSVISTSATLTNAGGARSGNGDFYAWGLSDGNEAGDSSADVRAIGIQTFAASDVVGAAAQPNERFLVFAINTYNRWSNAATNEFDIYVDVDKDKKADYIVVGVDQGAVQTGTFNGRIGAFVFSTRSPGATLLFLASDPTNSSTELLPILGRQLCRAGEPCLDAGQGHHLLGGELRPQQWCGRPSRRLGEVRRLSRRSSVKGRSPTVAPGATANVPFSINVGAFNSTKPLGLMVVSLDNASGAAEAKLLPISLKK